MCLQKYKHYAKLFLPLLRIIEPLAKILGKNIPFDYVFYFDLPYLCM